MKYIVGNKYDEFISLREKSDFTLSGAQAELILLWNNLSEKEIKELLEGEVFFQLFLREGIIFLLIKFGALEWVDVPFVSHGKAQNLSLPQSENLGYAIRVLLADAKSGKLLVNRLEALSHGLSKALFWAIKEQIENPPKNIIRKINKVHAAFSSSEMARLSLGR